MATSGEFLVAAVTRSARGWQRETLSVQQPQRLGHQIAAISPGAATDSGDLPRADGLSLMDILGVSEGGQYNALLRGHAVTLAGRSDAVALAARSGRRSRLQRRKRPENPDGGSAGTEAPRGLARRHTSRALSDMTGRAGALLLVAEER